MVTPFHEIYTFKNGNKLYLGSQSAVGGWPDKWNYNDNDYVDAKNKLMENNIRSIVCCAELFDFWKDDFSYLHIPMESNDNFDITKSCFTAWP